MLSALANQVTIAMQLSEALRVQAEDNEALRRSHGVADCAKRRAGCAAPIAAARDAAPLG